MGKLSFLHTTLGIIVNQRTDVDRLIYEAHRLGIKVITYSRGNYLAIRDADITIKGQLNDKVALKKFATQCQIVIYMNGSGISAAMVNYLQRFTDVPQGAGSLDVTNDLSIQRVFLNTINVKSLPYDTVFNANDVVQALNKLGGPILLRPVQTDHFNQHELIINNADQLSTYESMFNGEAYLVESLPDNARYFKLTVIKSQSSNTVLPVLEEHYNGQKLESANFHSKGDSNLSPRFNAIALQIAKHINYFGSLSFSFVLMNDGQIYVDGINFSFDLVNNVYNLTSDNIYQLFLRAIMGYTVKFDHADHAWTIKFVDRNDLSQLKDLWINDDDIKLNLSPLVNRTGQNGYMLIKNSVQSK